MKHSEQPVMPMHPIARRALVASCLALATPLVAWAMTTVGTPPVNPNPAQAPLVRSGSVSKLTDDGRTITVDGTRYPVSASVKFHRGSRDALKRGTAIQYTVTGGEVVSITVIDAGKRK